MNSLNLTFPGQGTQRIGMGRDFYESSNEIRELFHHIDEIAELPISKFCFEGPETKLYDGVISGLAVFACSMAISKYLPISLKNNVKSVAGYSIGQYSAMADSEILSLEKIAPIIRKRGEYLKEAAKETESTMIGVIGVQVPDILKISEDYELYISNENSPGNYSISCKRKDLEGILKDLGQFNPIRAMALNVEGGWHSPFMKTAANKLRGELEKVQFENPKCLFYENVYGENIEDINDLKRLLVEHVTSPVKWIDVIRNIKGSVDGVFLEVGVGKQLSQFTKFISRKSKVIFTDTLAEAQQQLSNL